MPTPLETMVHASPRSKLLLRAAGWRASRSPCGGEDSEDVGSMTATLGHLDPERLHPELEASSATLKKQRAREDACRPPAAEVDECHGDRGPGPR